MKFDVFPLSLIMILFYIPIVIISDKNNYKFNDKCLIIKYPKLSNYTSNKQYHKSKKYISYNSPIYIHIDHKFTHGLGHAFDIYGIAIAISLKYNFTIIYEPLLHDHNHGNHSISYHSIQSNDFDFLGLQLDTENRSEIELKYKNNLIIENLNQPCSFYNFDRTIIKTISSVSIDSIYNKIDDILIKRDINKPLLIQGCGFPISFKFLMDDMEIYDYWRYRMEQYANLVNANNNKPSINKNPISFFNDGSRSSSSSSSSSDNNHGNFYRDIAVHIRRGDFLLPIYHQRLLSDDYYTDIICHLLSILDNDKINRFIILSESNVEQQQQQLSGQQRFNDKFKTKSPSIYIDEKSQPSDIKMKIELKCPSYTTKSKWELIYLIDASVLVTVKTMIYSSFLITSKSGFSR